MKWIALNKSFATVRVFNLVENNSIKEVLRYNPRQKSARLRCNDKQRVFFIEQAGFRNNHYVFKNEYGFETARIYCDNIQSNSGVIEIDQTRIQFSLPHAPRFEMVIYEEDGIKPKDICSLQTPDEDIAITSFNKKEFTPEQASLFWGFYWYTLNQAEKESLADVKAQLLPA